jgi:hypothetical protein
LLTLVANVKRADNHSQRTRKRRRGWQRVALPGTYAYYLVNVSRFDDAIAFARQKLPGTADGVARAWLQTSWAIALGTKTSFMNPEVESLYRASRQADPQFWWAYNNISSVQAQRGDEEAAWRTQEEFQVAAGGALVARRRLPTLIDIRSHTTTLRCCD